jgi:hypothetical protein
VDYRGLKKVTIRNRYALPLISSLLERISGAKFFLLRLIFKVLIHYKVLAYLLRVLASNFFCKSSGKVAANDILFCSEILPRPLPRPCHEFNHELYCELYRNKIFFTATIVSPSEERLRLVVGKDE